MEAQKVVMTGGILAFVHYKWQVLLPIVMQLFTIPCQMLTAPLMEVYFFGVEMSRPFPEAKNPLSEMMGAMGGEEGAKKEAGAEKSEKDGKELKESGEGAGESEDEGEGKKKK